MEQCASCHEPIEWVLTPNDAWMPMNIGRVLGGNYSFGVRDGRIRHVTPHPELLAYTSHLDTCPYADAYRRAG